MLHQSNKSEYFINNKGKIKPDPIDIDDEIVEVGLRKSEVKAPRSYKLINTSKKFESIKEQQSDSDRFRTSEKVYEDIDKFEKSLK